MQQHLVTSIFRPGGSGQSYRVSSGRLGCWEREVLRTPSGRSIPVLAFLAVALGAVACLAQAPDSRRAKGDEPSGEQAEGSVREVQPPVLYLRNKEGGLLQAVLGFTLEDFERFMTQRAQLALGQQPPRFRLEKLVCEGKAGQTHADLSIRIDAVVNDQGWVRIPLRLADAVLRSPPQYQGPGEHILDFDAAAGEHVLWLKGQSDRPHKLTFDVVMPLEKRGDQTEMKLGFPRATISELTLTVPDPEAIAKVHEGAVLESTRHTPTATEFKVLGMARDFEIGWRKERKEATDAPALLEALGAISAVVDGESVKSDFELTVRSFAARLDSFRIQLPEDTTLAAEEQPGYAIEPLEERKPGEPGGNSHKPRLYEVRLREVAAGPVTIRFSTERPHASRGEPREFQLAGVELVGAARQWGHIAVRVDDDWQVSWGELRQVRQVDDLPVELDGEGVQAGFEYANQPFSIAGRVAPRQSHTTVEPIYTIQVDPRRLRLEARLKYQVRGAKTFGIDVTLAGWQLDDVAPRNTFDVDRLAVDQGESARVPLLQPATGEIELVLKAHRELEPGAAAVDFDLPLPAADTVGAAQVTVVPAENVLLTLRDGSLEGLTRERGGAAGTGTLNRRRPLAFVGEGARMRFVADLHVEERRLWAEVRTRLQVDEQAAKIDETIDYTIAHAPASELVLNVPDGLQETGRLKFTMAGQTLTQALVTDDESNEDKRARVRVVLPEKRIGNCQLLVHFPFASERLVAGVSVPLTVPLVMPADAEISVNELSVVAGPGIQVQSHDESWSVTPSAATAGRLALRLASQGARDHVALDAHLEPRREFDPTVVERAWLQTRLASGERWDRAVYQFTSGDSRIRLGLPPGAIAAEARAVLDGAAVMPQMTSQRDALWFDLDPARRRHVLDVSYRFAARASQHGRLELAAPELGEDLWVRQTLWQLVVPRDEHLVWWPSTVSGEFQWQWQGGLWGRQPTFDQRQLEAWVDAAPASEAPSATNRYVFGALAPVATLEVYTASRTALVLMASGAVLAASLLLLYVPAVRRPSALLAGGLCLAAIGLVFPEPILIVAQASAVGLILSVVATVLRRFMLTRRGGPLVMRSGSSSIVEPGSTKTHQRPQPLGAVAEAAPLAAQMSASEGES